MTDEQMKFCNERLAIEYLSKVKCCDECFCEFYCIVNGKKKSRVPYKGCEENIMKNVEELSIFWNEVE